MRDTNAVYITKFGGPEVLEYRQTDKPVVAPHQVLIKTAVTSVNFADVKARYGNKGSKQPPFIPGMDVSGTIVETGAEVNQDVLPIGSRVAAFPDGSYAEYVIADQRLAFPLPGEVDFETGAACPAVAFTAYKLLADIGKLSHGESVLIHAAAGGVGTSAIQLAKILGAGQVIGAVSTDEKAALASEAGADHVINTSKEDFVSRVLELTAGEGADVIMDSIAGEVTGQSMQCLAYYGRLVQFGNASGQIGTIQSKDLHSGCRSVLGFSMGTTRARRPHLIKPVADKVLGYLATGRLKMFIGDRFPLKEARIAHELMENRKVMGKILLIP